MGGDYLSSRQHAFLYSDHAMRDLGTLGGTPGETYSAAFDVNEAGQVVGTSGLGDSTVRLNAFLYSGGVMRSLGTLPGDQYSSAVRVNSSGQVVGRSYNILGETEVNHAFLYSNGVMQGIWGGSFKSEALGINDAGQVVGYYFGPGLNCSHAFLYSAGHAQDIGTLPGTACSEAQAVNGLGQVAGVAYNSGDTESRRLFFYSGGVMRDLGRIGGHLSFVTSMNDAGQIVGCSNERSRVGQAGHAFLYSDGALTDLNSLLPAGSGLLLVSAEDINERGQIVGYSNFDSTYRRHAFLLTPSRPVLLTEPNSDKAVALDSVTLMRDPFPVLGAHNFSEDGRTRIILFARYAALAPGEPALVLTAQAEDAQHKVHPLPVEHVVQVPGFGWLTQVVVRLPDEIADAGDVSVSITLRGAESNRAGVSIRPDAAVSR